MKSSTHEEFFEVLKSFGYVYYPSYINVNGQSWVFHSYRSPMLNGMDVSFQFGNFKFMDVKYDSALELRQKINEKLVDIVMSS